MLRRGEAWRVIWRLAECTCNGTQIIAPALVNEELAWQRFVYYLAYARGLVLCLLSCSSARLFLEAGFPVTYLPAVFGEKKGGSS